MEDQGTSSDFMWLHWFRFQWSRNNMEGHHSVEAITQINIIGSSPDNQSHYQQQKREWTLKENVPLKKIVNKKSFSFDKASVLFSI